MATLAIDLDSDLNFSKCSKKDSGFVFSWTRTIDTTALASDLSGADLLPDDGEEDDLHSGHNSRNLLDA